MKTIKSYYEFGSSKISEAQNFLDQTIFKIFTWHAKFCHLELAMKFQISDKKTNWSD